MKKHLEKGAKNAQYTSPKIQNDILNLCGVVIRENLIFDVKAASAYSILADISEKEQLSIGIRFYDQKEKNLREEFMSFVITCDHCIFVCIFVRSIMSIQFFFFFFFLTMVSILKQCEATNLKV